MPNLILVVDDDLSVLRLMEMRLKKLGYQVMTACDGLDALDIVGEQTPEQNYKTLLLLDIEMPQTDGVATCRILRERGFGGPVLAHTGTDCYNTRKLCEQVGFDGYLVKPVDQDSLKAAIECFSDQQNRAA